jgi:hypothetical protein
VTMEVLMHTPKLWTSFLIWNATITARALPITARALPIAQPTECAGLDASLKELSAIATSARRALAAGANLRTCPMALLPKYNLKLFYLEPLFAAADMSLQRAELERTLKDIASARVQLRDVKRVALDLLARYDSEILRCCTVLEGGWERNSLADAQAFLGLQPEANAPLMPPSLSRRPLMPLRLQSKGGRNHELRPLPAMLVAALPWLLAVCDTTLFQQFWRDAAADRAEPEAEAPSGDGSSRLGVSAATVDHLDAALEEELWLCKALSAVRHRWATTYRHLATQHAHAHHGALLPSPQVGDDVPGAAHAEWASPRAERGCGGAVACT